MNSSPVERDKDRSLVSAEKQQENCNEIEPYTDHMYTNNQSDYLSVNLEVENESNPILSQYITNTVLVKPSVENYERGSVAVSQNESSETHGVYKPLFPTHIITKQTRIAHIRSFDCDEAGGKFVCFDKNIEEFPQLNVTVPPSAVDKITEFAFEQIPVQKQRPKIAKCNDTFLTNIVNLNPHKQDFLERIQVDFYFNQDLNNTNNVRVLYNEADCTEEPQWRILTSKNPSGNDPTFKIYTDHATLYFKHFCQVAIVQTSEGVQYNHRILAAGLKASYQPRSKRLDVTAVLQKIQDFNSVYHSVFKHVININTDQMFRLTHILYVLGRLFGQLRFLLLFNSE